MDKEKYIDLTGGCLLKNKNPILWEFTAIKCGAKTQSFTEFPIHYRLWTPKILNQHNKFTCVSCALSTMKTIQDYYDTSKVIKYSTSYIYLLRDDNQFQGNGMYISEALDNLRKYGVVPYEQMPDNLDYAEGAKIKIIQQQNEKLRLEGKKHLISNFAIVDSVDDMKQALLDHNPIPIGANLYGSFYNTNETGIVENPQPNIERNHGGHCMLIVGWTVINDKEYWVVQNSWGEYWGDNGFCYLEIDKFPILEKYIVFDVTDYPLQFDDTKGRWSEKAIEKCIRAGLINGYEDGTFRPTDFVTREQLATILYKLLQ